MRAHAVQELGGVFGGGAFIGSCDGPFGERIVGGELLDRLAWRNRDGERVDLDDIAGLLERDGLGLAHGVGPLFRGRARPELAQEVGRGGHAPALDEIAEDAADRGVADGKAELAHERPDLGPAPHRKVEPEALDRGLSAGGAVRAPHATGTPAERRGPLAPAMERGTGRAHRASGSLPPSARLRAHEPARHGVASSRRFDIRGLRCEKTRRRPRGANKMAGQAKNLHGVLL